MSSTSLSRSALRVEGGTRLGGTIRPQGNKNAALPLLTSSLLTAEPFVLRNVPAIDDVATMVRLLGRAGVRTESPASGVVVMRADGDIRPALDRRLAARIRSVMVAGPMLARCGRILLPLPGGDRIGRRRVDAHMSSLAAMGVEIDVRPDGYELSAPRGLHGAHILLEEASVTATESTLMAACFARGDTTIYHAACEPHVQELCQCLNARGAHIEGIGTNRLRVCGVQSLRGGTHALHPDHQEVASFIGLAAATGSELRIQGVLWDHIPVLCRGFHRLGVRIERDGEDLRVPGGQRLEVQTDYDGSIPRIDDGPWPAFPSDALSIALVTATQARGAALFHEKMFESRLFFVDRLIEMGARIVLCDPHRCVVSGPSPLRGIELASPDIRAGMALLIAALCAEGVSVVHNVSQITRGYEHIIDRLRGLGATIEAIDNDVDSGED